MVTLNADQAERLGREEGDEITVEAAPTTVVEDTTTTTPAADAVNDQFIEETLIDTGFADAAGDQGFASYVRVVIPGGYSAEAPADWAADADNDGDSITLNKLSWMDYQSGVQIAPRTGDPTAILEAHVAGDYGTSCQTKGTVATYDYGQVTGVAQSFQGCQSDVAATVITGKINGDPSGKVILLDAVVGEPRDVLALARILATLAPPS